jgi:ectoine hydroxylase-related dioxygenase (phytanoyl-CoA dioxygenase family)
VFAPDDLDGIDGFFRAQGFAVLRGLLDDAALAAIEDQCVAAQRALEAGELAERYGTTVLVGEAARAAAGRIANYVTHVSELAPAAAAAAGHPAIVSLVRRWIGEGAWLMDDTRFGVVWQDAYAGRDSAYSRIGWHSDWQSGPDLDIWPSVAFTVHLDATSPANGFLRVVPGSHRWATPAPYDNVNGAVVPAGSAPAGGHTGERPPFPMPPRFEKVPGELAVYAERGDVLFHDGYLWHAAARATDDDARRRHLRGSWYSGAGRLATETVDSFVKNAAR